MVIYYLYLYLISKANARGGRTFINPYQVRVKACRRQVIVTLDRAIICHKSLLQNVRSITLFDMYGHLSKYTMNYMHLAFPRHVNMKLNILYFDRHSLAGVVM